MYNCTSIASAKIKKAINSRKSALMKPATTSARTYLNIKIDVIVNKLSIILQRMNINGRKIIS